MGDVGRVVAELGQSPLRDRERDGRSPGSCAGAREPVAFGIAVDRVLGATYSFATRELFVLDERVDELPLLPAVLADVGAQL